MKHITTFKIFEESSYDKLVPIATNEINWGWEDDSVHIKATIFFDPTGSNELFLHIRKVHTKHGLGAGQFPSDVLSNEPIGTINKPDLRKVQTLLREHRFGSVSRAGGGGFKRQWVDIKGDGMALGKIITNSRYLKLTNLKHRLTKKHTPKIEPKNIQIMKYGRGYVIYGQGTKIIKDKLKDIGAKFNFRLTHPVTKEKFVGWVISPNKLNDVKQLTGVEEIITESYAPQELFWLKDEIKTNFENDELVQYFLKMYDEFFDVIIEDSELDSEDPDELLLNFAESVRIFIDNSDLDQLEIAFLENYLRNNEFKISSTINSYDDLSEESAIIYDNLEQRFEIVFWTALEMQITRSL